MSKKVFIGCLMVALVLGTNCQITNELWHNIGNMIRGETNIATLADVTSSQGFFYQHDTNPNEIHGLLGFGGIIHGGVMGQRQVYPYARMRALLFGANTKVTTLVYENQINAAGGGYVIANAIFGRRTGDFIQLRSAYGTTSINPKPQNNQTTVRVCHTHLFHKKCHDEIRLVPRGFFQHELDALVQETERRAAISMRQSLGLGMEPFLGNLGSMFQHENNLLRTLYREIEYEFTDFTALNFLGFPDALLAGTKGILNASLRQRIWEWVVSRNHYNFLTAADDRVLYFITAKTTGELIDVHISQFTIVTGRLPAGFLGINGGGGWYIERNADATPSVNQIAAIFQGLR